MPRNCVVVKIKKPFSIHIQPNSATFAVGLINGVSVQETTRN